MLDEAGLLASGTRVVWLYASGNSLIRLGSRVVSALWHRNAREHGDGPIPLQQYIDAREVYTQTFSTNSFQHLDRDDFIEGNFQSGECSVVHELYVNPVSKASLSNALLCEGLLLLGQREASYTAPCPLYCLDCKGAPACSDLKDVVGRLIFASSISPRSFLICASSTVSWALPELV